MIKILLAGIIALVFGALIGGVLVGEYITYNYHCEKKNKKQHRRRHVNYHLVPDSDRSHNFGVHPAVDHKTQQSCRHDQGKPDYSKGEL